MPSHCSVRSCSDRLKQLLLPCFSFCFTNYSTSNAMRSVWSTSTSAAATKHGTGPLLQSTATEHATSSSSTATEHATSYASASVSSDGVHLAENFAKSQPPASGAVRGKRRATVQVTLTESQYYDLVDIRHPRNCLTSCVGLYHPVLQIQS